MNKILKPIGLEHNQDGWYFWMTDGLCKIGPYRDPRECQADFDRYVKTGRISTDATGKIGDSKA